jgi:hypothetical protein
MALGTAGLTAALAIQRMEHNGLSPANGPVVVSGATGGVGSLAVAALARRGYSVTALTGKAQEGRYLQDIGAREIIDRQAIDSADIKPLGPSTWAGAVDNVGGRVLAWMASTMQRNGVIASIGLAGDSNVTTTVMPFILRGVSLLGINSSDAPVAGERERAWQRLAGDLKPPALDRIARTIDFRDLPSDFDRFFNGTIRGRLVVKIAALLLCVAALTGCNFAPASLIDDLPVTIENNLVFVPVRVNGSAPLTFILDTGAGGMVLDARRVAELGLQSARGDDAQAFGGPVEAGQIAGVTFQIGTVMLPGVTTTTLDLRPIDAGTGTRIDGIIGYELFAKHVVEIDYAGSHVRLHDPAEYRQAGGVELPVDIEDQLAFGRIQVIGDAGNRAQARVEIDTGLTGALSLVRDFVDSHQLVPPEARRLRITTAGLGSDQVPAEVVRFERVDIAGVPLQQVVATVPPSTAAAGVEGNVDGILGGEIFRRFFLVIDYPHKRVLFQPNGRINDPYVFDMSGMSLVATPDGARIRTVVAGSPATDAGLMAGDAILSVDGRAVSGIPLSELRAMFQQEGRRYTLQVRRGDATREVVLTTRRLI